LINLANKKAFLGLFKTDEFGKIKLKFKTTQGALFFDGTAKKTIKGDGFEGEFTISLSKAVEIYLDLKTFEDTFEGNQYAVDITEESKKIVFYTTEKRPATLQIKAVDYKRKTAGMLYIDITSYSFVLLLSYMSEFLSRFPVLSYSVFNINFSYNREDKILLITDKDINNTIYIKEENITVIKELFDYYLTRGGMFTHCFTPDRNVYIDRELNFFINDKKFSVELFKKTAYLVSI
jgi:hypothetical protein